MSCRTRKSRIRRMHASLFSRRSLPGSAPGTLIVYPNAPKPIMRLVAFGPDKVIEKDIEDVQTVRSVVGQRPVTWINVAGLGDLSVITNRTNEIMKFLTIFTAVFFPMTLIAGIYGMNFNTRVSPWNMPELERS